MDTKEGDVGEACWNVTGMGIEEDCGDDSLGKRSSWTTGMLRDRVIAR